MKIALGIAALMCAAVAFAAPATASWFHSNAKAQISGQVVDDRYGKPLEGIDVMAVSAGTTTVEASTTSDKNGRFTLRGLRAGDYRLVFQRPGSGQAYVDGIAVRADDHLVLISPFAVPNVAVALTQEIGMRPQCGKLLQPGQTADVYVVCSGY
ncbi:MAG TPA: carboxypeptidase-like regulatory domain-containing protein [Candidatus Eremiobacteraceae bacterium]|nr:carboxypeptidase-like regulatory domain-containing protein [Candidatus Eremiobacteraceae bacterium]